MLKEAIEHLKKIQAAALRSAKDAEVEIQRSSGKWRQ